MTVPGRLLSRRDLLVSGARIGLLFSAAPTVLLAACQPASPGGSPSGTRQPAAETTWERIQREGIVRAGFSNDVPYAYAEAGLLTGSDPETLRAIMTDYGVETIEGVLVDFAGLIPGLLAKRFDIIAGVMTVRPERCEQIAFSEPNTPLVVGMAVPKGNPLNFHSFDDVVNHPTARVGLLTGSAYVEYWLDFYQLAPDRLTQYPEVAQGIAALEAGRVDVYGSPTTQLEPFYKQNDLIEAARPFAQPVDPDGKPLVGLAADGFRLEDTDFVDAYNTGLAKLKESGKLLEILNQFNFGVTADEVELLNTPTADLCAGP